MSRDYEANNPKANGNLGSTYNANVSACELLGDICRVINFGKPVRDRFYPPWEATKEECIEAAKRLENLKESDFDAIYKLDFELIQGPIEDLREFIREWIDFLETCDGYKVLI